MDFGPGLDESLLGARQIAANALDRIEREHALGIQVRRMKVRPVVRVPTSMNIRMMIPKNLEISGIG